MNIGAQVHLPALSFLSDVTVTALADAGSGRAADLARGLHPVPAAFADGVSLIKNADVDLIVIATPPSSQARLVLAALEAGRPVLCEKPFGVSLDEAERMTAAAAAAGVATAIGFQFRYDAGLRRLHEAVLSGAIGEIHRIDVSWLTSGGRKPDRQWDWRHDAREGGVLTEFCTHVFDYLALLTGAPVAAVSMAADTVIGDRPSGTSRRKVDASDRVELLVRLGRVIAHVSASNVEPFALGHRVEVHGAHGRLTFHHRPPFRNSDISLWLTDANGEKQLPVREAPVNSGADSRVAAARNLWADLITAIGGGDAPLLPDFADGLAARRAVALAEASSAAPTVAGFD